MDTRKTMVLPAGVAICCAVLVCCPLAAEQMCKWVDENGTVHYAERCPETADGAPVEIEQGPTPEAIEAARLRAEEQAAVKRAQQQSRSRAEEAQAGARQAAALKGTQKDLCRHALRDSAILKQQLPVYADSTGVYHLRSSLHFWYYDGRRAWLDDDQRQAELERYMQIIESQCADVTTADLPYLRTFRYPPGVDEVLRHFEAYDPENVLRMYREEAADWCAYGRHFLAQDETSSLRDPGIPRLRELIEAKCP